MIKRLIPLLLTVVMLTSCAGPAEPLLDFLGPQNEVQTYNGETVIIDGPPFFNYSDDTSLQSDAIRQRLADIQKKLNVVIEFCEEGRTTVSTIAGNVYTSDIIYRSTGSSLVDYAHGGMLCPMTNFPQFIDLRDTDKYGTPGATEAALAKGIPYGIQPTYWPGMQGIECFFIAYNRDMMSKMGLTDLHEYYENKTWVWDNFYSTLAQAEELVVNDQTTFQAQTSYLMNTIFLSNGFDYIYIVDGEPRFNVVSPDAVNAVEFMQKINDFEKVKIGSERWDVRDFVNGISLTTMAIAKDVTVGDIAYGADFDYSIMPFPCGPDAEYGKWAQSVTRISGFGIPLSSKNPEIAAHVLSELFEPFENFGTTREELKDYYANSIFLTPTDAEIYFAVDQNVRYDYDDLGFLESFVGAVALSARTRQGTPVEILQKYSDTAEVFYKAYMEENLTGYLIEKMNITE